MIPPITPHSLRHTYCSLLIAQGEDLATVADHMRHSDQSTTLKIYTHVMKHRRKGVAERLDRRVRHPFWCRVGAENASGRRRANWRRQWVPL